MPQNNAGLKLPPMITQAYNFIASWQLFPEKGEYGSGHRPKSGYYKIAASSADQKISIHKTWTTLENESFVAEFAVAPDGEKHSFDNPGLAKEILANLDGTSHFNVRFFSDDTVVLDVQHSILPNGFLKVIQQGFDTNGEPYTNTEVFHKQMSVLPYASAVSGALIRPTEEGMIRHKALTAMEEQTNMQMDQIRRQIELLAQQAREIVARKDLSMIIYSAKLQFTPVIGQVYYLYEKRDNTHQVSMIAPKEWGSGIGPFKSFIAKVKLLADHTWVEIQ